MPLQRQDPKNCLVVVSTSNLRSAVEALGSSGPARALGDEDGVQMAESDCAFVTYEMSGW